MPLRFRKTLRILPGVRLNFSKSGASVSVGKKGATVNIRPDRQKVTVGVPGSGLSYSEDFKAGELKTSRGFWRFLLLILIGAAILFTMHYFGISL